MKISELTDTQKSHLAWRLDHKTRMGLGTAGRTARGKMGDMDLVEVFKLAGKTEHSAKIHARKVINFKVDERKREASEASMQLLQGVFEQTDHMDRQTRVLVAKYLRGGLQTWERMQKAVL